MRNDDGKTFSVPHWCYGIIITLLYASHASQLSISFQKSRNKSGQNDFQSFKITSNNKSDDAVKGGIINVTVSNLQYWKQMLRTMW